VALVGAAKPGTEVNFEIGLSLIKGWTFKTIIEGSSVPRTFIPALVRLWKQGKFPFDKLIEKYPFAEINRASDDSEHGTTIKPVVIF
jgi:aryl-alcohol dehydrogenase